MATYTEKGTRNSTYTLEFNVAESNLIIPENYSTVEWNSYLVSTTYYFSTIGMTAYAAINGQEVLNSYAQRSIGKNSRLFLGGGTLTVPHNPDGSKTISLSASLTMNATDSYLPGNTSVSGTLKLTDIPRTSSVSCNSFNIGDATTIVISRANNNFRHSAGWSFGNESGIIADRTSETVIGTTLPASELYTQIPNARFGTGTIWCDTFYNDEHIGTSYCEFTAYAKEGECIPEVSATVIDTNDTTIALTGCNTKFIKGFSNAQVTIGAIPKNSATIKGYWVNMGDGRTSDKASTLFNNIGSNYLSVSATDTRDYAKGVPYILDWIDYVMLAFTKIEIKRPESTADKANMTVQGNYWNGNFGNKDNSLILQYRYKENGGAYSEWTSLTPTKSGNTFSYTQLIENLDHNKEYLFQFMIDDELMTVYSNDEDGILTKGIPVLRVGKDYVRINGALENIKTGIEYATNEFIDDNQVYRKRIDCGDLPNATIKNIAHGLSNVSFVRIEGIVYEAGYTYPIPYVAVGSLGETSINSIGIATTQEAIIIVTNRTVEATAVVDLYYTKNS